MTERYLLCGVAGQELEDLIECRLVDRHTERQARVTRRTVGRCDVLRGVVGRGDVQVVERLDELHSDLGALRLRQDPSAALGLGLGAGLGVGRAIPRSFLLQLEDVPGELDGPKLEDLVDRHIADELHGSSKLADQKVAGVEEPEGIPHAVGASIYGHGSSFSGKYAHWTVQ